MQDFTSVLKIYLFNEPNSPGLTEKTFLKSCNKIGLWPEVITRRLFDDCSFFTTDMCHDMLVHDYSMVEQINLVCGYNTFQNYNCVAVSTG